MADINALQLPEYINNLCVDFNSCPKEDIPKDMETCRVLRPIYQYLKFAKHCLDIAGRTTEEINTRCMYCNCAIIWYYNSFDLLLQAIRLYNRYYTSSHVLSPKKTINDISEISSKNIETILEMCTWNVLKQTGYGNLANIQTFKKTFDKVRKLSNRLKHRREIIYFENDKESISYQTDIRFDKKSMKFIEHSNPEEHYNSIKTAQKERLDDVLELLCNYHKDFEVLLKSNLQFMNIIGTDETAKL